MTRYIFLLLFTISLSNCASAKVVSSIPGKSGIVAISQVNQEEARIKAMTLMERTCTGKSVEIVKEGEVVIGQRTDSNTNTDFNEKNKSNYVGASAGAVNKNTTYNNNSANTSATGVAVKAGSSSSDTTGSVKSNSSTTTVNVTEYQIEYKCK
ncbi:MAG: hypothetical protein IPL26_04685 [Leptospiraceae bacterium]|nr:hypothetical protein [Leptospiraceae bacterium]